MMKVKDLEFEVGSLFNCVLSEGVCLKETCIEAVESSPSYFEYEICPYLELAWDLKKLLEELNKVPVEKSEPTKVSPKLPSYKYPRNVRDHGTMRMMLRLLQLTSVENGDARLIVDDDDNVVLVGFYVPEAGDEPISVAWIHRGDLVWERVWNTETYKGMI